MTTTKPAPKKPRSTKTSPPATRRAPGRKKEVAAGRATGRNRKTKADGKATTKTEKGQPKPRRERTTASRAKQGGKPAGNGDESLMRLVLSYGIAKVEEMIARLKARR